LAHYVSYWGGTDWTEPVRLPGLENLEGGQGCDIGPTGDWMIII